VLAIGIHPEPWLDGVASAGTYLNLLGR